VDGRASYNKPTTVHQQHRPPAKLTGFLVPGASRWNGWAGPTFRLLLCDFLERKKSAGGKERLRRRVA
jgi:hypothetical protein